MQLQYGIMKKTVYRVISSCLDLPLPCEEVLISIWFARVSFQNRLIVDPNNPILSATSCNLPSETWNHMVPTDNFQVAWEIFISKVSHTGISLPDTIRKQMALYKS